MSLIVEITFWATIFLGTAALLFCSVYALVLYSDLRDDHVNPIELCATLNRLVLPEYLGHFYVTAMLLLRGYLFTTLLNLPLLAFHMQRYRTKCHLLDNTSIFSDANRETRVCEVKLGLHLLMFFIYLYLFIVKLVSE